jgi:hypothetical protein
MKAISAAALILASMAAGNAASAAIPCQEAPGREERGVYWSWREIDGKRCWYIREGRSMPPKSQFAWAKEQPEQPVEKYVPAPPEARNIGPTIQIVRVKPEKDVSENQANWLDDAPVELISGADLSGAFGIGGSWVLPAYNGNKVDQTPLSQGRIRDRRVQ